MFAWLFGGNKSEEEKQTGSKSKRSHKSEDRKWVQQALLQFLMSKQWRITLLNFVDNSCMVFDSEEENKFQYTAIHNKFKSLVAGLFDSVMDDVGIDSKTLVSEIAKGLESKNKRVFEQLLYVQDFLMFKGMMVKRNMELEKEAIRVMNGKGREGKDKRRNVMGGEGGGAYSSRSDNEVMKEILKISKMEEEERRKKEEQLREHEERVMEESEREYLRSLEESKKGKEREEEQRRVEKQRQRQNGEKQNRENKQRQKEKKLQMLKQKREKLEQDKRVSELRLLKEQQNLRQNLIKQEQQSSFKYPLQQLPSNTLPVSTPSTQPTKQQIEERRQKLTEYREMLRNKRNQEMEQGESQGKDNILFGAGGVIDSEDGNGGGSSEVKLRKEEIERRKELMRRIKNKIVEDC